MKEQISKSLLEALTENGSDKITTSELTVEDFERWITALAMRSTEKRKPKMYCSKDFFEKSVAANGKRWLKHFLISVDVTSNLEGINYVRSLNLNEVTEFPCGDTQALFECSGNSDANCHRKRKMRALKLITKTPSTCDGCVYNDTHNNH